MVWIYKNFGKKKVCIPSVFKLFYSHLLYLNNLYQTTFLIKQESLLPIDLIRENDIQGYQPQMRFFGISTKFLIFILSNIQIVKQKRITTKNHPCFSDTNIYKLINIKIKKSI